MLQLKKKSSLFTEQMISAENSVIYYNVCVESSQGRNSEEERLDH